MFKIAGLIILNGISALDIYWATGIDFQWVRKYDYAIPEYLLSFFKAVLSVYMYSFPHIFLADVIRQRTLTNIFGNK